MRHPHSNDLDTLTRAVRLVCTGLVATAFLAVAGCGDGAQANDAGVAENAASSFAGQDTSQDTVVYNVGDVYDNGEFRATYLGMAALPLGTGNVFDDGSCVALLFEATYLAPAGSRDRFSPSVRGYFADGREAKNDGTGVGCEFAGLRELGYERGVSRRFSVDESARVYVGAIHIPAADDGQLAYATIYGSEFVRMNVEYVHSP